METTGIWVLPLSVWFALQPAGLGGTKLKTWHPRPGLVAGSVELNGSHGSGAVALSGRRGLLAEIDDRLRIVVRAPLRDPPAAIRAVGVEAFALALRVQDPEPRLGVDAGACDPLPVAFVLRGVVVGKQRREPLLASPPVDVQVLDEEAR